MLPDVINGLPAHVLLIHVLVALTPLGALFTILCAVWPAARRKLGFVSPLTCLVALVFVPLTTHAGEWFRNRIDPQHRNSSITKHADLGGTFVYYVLGLFIVSVAVWLLGRRFGTDASATDATATAVRTDVRPLPQWASITVAVVAVAVAVLAVWQCYRVGDSGAHAVWDGTLRR